MDTMTDIDSDSLVDDPDFLTPSQSKELSRIKLTDSVTVYSRFESHFVFFRLVLFFDSQGACAPKSLPILFYWHIAVLDIWEKLEDDSD